MREVQHPAPSAEYVHMHAIFRGLYSGGTFCDIIINEVTFSSLSSDIVFLVGFQYEGLGTTEWTLKQVDDKPLTFSRFWFFPW